MEFLSCFLCDFDSDNKLLAIDHLKNHLNESDPEMCKKIKKYITKIKNTKINNFICPNCDIRYNRITKLNEHIDLSCPVLKRTKINDALKIILKEATSLEYINPIIESLINKKEIIKSGIESKPKTAKVVDTIRVVNLKAVKVVGQENLEIFDDQEFCLELLKGLNGRFDNSYFIEGLCNFFNHLHTSWKYSENWNLYCISNRSNEIYVYSGQDQGWIKMNKYIILKQVFIQILNIIIDLTKKSYKNGFLEEEYYNQIKQNINVFNDFNQKYKCEQLINRFINKFANILYKNKSHIKLQKDSEEYDPEKYQQIKQKINKYQDKSLTQMIIEKQDKVHYSVQNTKYRAINHNRNFLKKIPEFRPFDDPKSKTN